ncbi:MAG: hypothetical protein ACPGXK_00380 [Phycisphaerae bacterium]
MSLFPELDRFEDKQQRMQISQQAWQRQLSRPMFWIGLLLYGALMVVFVYGMMTQVARRIPIPTYLYGGIVGGVFGGGFMAWLQWLLREPIRRELRRKLNEEGMPTCVGCGYDMRGSIGGRQPEEHQSSPSAERPSAERPTNADCPECGRKSATTSLR